MQKNQNLNSGKKIYGEKRFEFLKFELAIIYQPFGIFWLRMLQIDRLSCPELGFEEK